MNVQNAKAIEDSLLKLMKAPPQPGTPPGAPVKPNKPTVATPGASGGGIPGGAAGAPGGAATTAPQANPQTNPYTTPTEHAKRSIQASMEKVDFSDTKPEGDIKHPIDMPNGDKVFQKPIQIRRREPSERTGDPNIKITRRTPSERTGGPNPVNLNFPRTIEESLLKLMKAPTDLTSQRRQAHMTNVGKTSQASREAGGAGQTLATRQDLNIAPGGAGDADAGALASTAANLLGAGAAREFYNKLPGMDGGTQPPEEFAHTGGGRSKADSFMPDANSPPNPQPPAQQAAPQGAVSGTGETATPTPDTNTPPPFKPQHIGANLLGGKKPS